jgi:RHS repeat-associated protein
MAFDANGRRTQKVRSDGSASQEYEYGPFGRLRRLTVAGVVKTLGYDHAGFRIHETRAGETRRFFGRHAESESGQLFKYYRMGDRLIATRVVASPELSGLRGPAPPLQIPPEAYWWAMSAISLLLLVPLGRTRCALGVRISQGGAFATAMLVAIVMLPMALGVGCVEAQDIRHYHTSHRGSPVAITGGSGELRRQIRYSAYGEVRRFDGAGGGTGIDPTNRLEFTGYATDPESELQYAGSRFYDPSQARFLSMDPREVDPNPYAYVGWDPVNFVDPNGEAGIASLFLGMLGVAAALAALQGIVVAIQTSSVTKGFKAAGLSFATGALGAISSILAPQALALVPMVTQGLAQASVAAVGMGYSVYGLTRGGSSEDAVFAGVGLAVSLALAAYGMRSGTGRQATSTAPGKPVSGAASSASADTAPGVALASGGGQRMDLIQQMLSILRNRAEAVSIQRAQLENQTEILRLRSEAILDRTVRGRPVLDQNVSAFEVYEFTVDSLGNQSFNSSIVAVEFSPGGSPLPSHPSVIGASGSHLMTVTTGPHPVACGRCRGVLVH